MTLSPTVCEDKSGKVSVGPNGNEKSCANAQNNQNICRYESIKDHCPVTCNTCPIPAPSPAPKTCSDTKQKFTMQNGKAKTCEQAMTSANLCNKLEAKLNCPVTCKYCYVLFPDETTDVPTHSPVVQPATDQCEDSTDILLMDSGKERTCSDARDRRQLCNKDIYVEKCPAACELCDTPSDGSCEDKTDNVVLSNGRNKSCLQAQANDALCNKWSEIRDHCPQTCGLCDTSSDGSCEDKTDKVLLPNGNTKSCLQAQTNNALCNKWSEIQDHCPQTCGLCDTISDGSCEDKSDKVLLPNGNNKSCLQAQTNDDLCNKWSEIRDHCPQTCGLC